MSFIVANAPYVPETSSAKVLVLACIDPRYTAILNWFLTNYKKLNNNYDLFVLAGASLGYNQASETPFSYPVGSPVTYNLANTKMHWDTVFNDHLVLARALHGVTEIWVFDHMGCGAYEFFLTAPVETAGLHAASMNKFLESISAFALTLSPPQTYNTKGFLLEKNSNIRLIYKNTADSATEIQVTPNDFGETINPYLLGVVVIGVFFIFFMLK
jgi:hypothetical protein